MATNAPTASGSTTSQAQPTTNAPRIHKKKSVAVSSRSIAEAPKWLAAVRTLSAVVCSSDVVLSLRLSPCSSHQPSRLGDGKWLIMLSLFLLPGLYVSITSSDYDAENVFAPYGCYWIHWCTVYFTVALGILISLHLLVWYFPRPVSQVDRSPISWIIGGITILGPPIFFIWMNYFVYYLTDNMKTCPYGQHRGLWNYFGLIFIFLDFGFLAIGFSFVSLTWEMVWGRRPTAPANTANQTAGSFTSDVTQHLDNGRWLTMEARRIKAEEDKTG